MGTAAAAAVGTVLAVIGWLRPQPAATSASAADVTLMIVPPSATGIASGGPKGT